MPVRSLNHWSKKATAFAKMVQSMKVDIIRCIMHTDKVFSLPTVPLANMDAFCKKHWALPLPVTSRPMQIH